VTRKPFAVIATACGLALVASVTGAAAPVALEYRVEKVVRSTPADGTASVARAPAVEVAPGDELVYTISFTNAGGETVPPRGVVVTNPLSAELDYLPGSASGADTEIAYSIDGGRTFLAGDAANGGTPASPIGAIQWTYVLALEAGGRGEVSFRARVKGTATSLDEPAEPPSVEGTESDASCFVVSPDGLIATSQHAVAGAVRMTVTLSTGKEYEASLVAESERTDLAVLRVPTRTPDFLVLAPARSVRVGQSVFTYGFPVADILGMEPKYTEGSISSLSGIKGEAAYMQISVPVQPGNSGGPLVNDSGQVVGIVAAQARIQSFLSTTGTLPQNVNWAVKSEYLGMLVDLPREGLTATSRDAAIEHTRAAICSVRVRH
jgi:uncharacterized repeat protein (TIGR01451 family)